MNSFPILSVQDISCIGQCSLTVALPILSAMGHECAILPTALLSSHTAFEHTSVLKLENEIPRIFDAWKKEGIRFSGIYTGYIGSIPAIEKVKAILSEFLVPNAPIIIDPVFGDNGRLYRHFDTAYVDAVKSMISNADVIFPNMTEACIMTDTPYTEEYQEETLALLHRKLRDLGARSSVITGIRPSPSEIAVSLDDGMSNDISLFKTKHVDRPSHGAGDVFASVVAGLIFSGSSLKEATETGINFTYKALRQTPSDHWYGIAFEPLLCELADRKK